ncbi:protein MICRORCHIDIA 6-like isoform X1 [Dioscorea cayenensis subsp. rotundata]|uniref:Protein MICRORCHIDIA 6-like isoform X1 n=2 Tax=Dioscorea cayennensis subsp. rotundata TaxID=55577 RepID=A0AB40CXL8_DIOCR|nr:protein MICRORCHIDIA 6-like isoform X1 [Dioscorea cayenensis subsp. rotundata]
MGRKDLYNRLQIGGYEMNLAEIIDLCDDDDETEVKDARGASILHLGLIKEKARSAIAIHQADFGDYTVREVFAPVESLNIPNGFLATGQLAHSANGVDFETSLPGSAPLCRQFWIAGDYEPVIPFGPTYDDGQNRMQVHPKFLHSNATSHKWAFGAIAELLDNALDEVHNGATFVALDKNINPQNGSPALLIRDDGGGMDPGSLRRCMSFGFSNKLLDSSIGQYGNGFKTSTMRLGADVVVFSRSMSQGTQSVGILSYTSLRQIGCDDVIVPVVDYKFDPVTGEYGMLACYSQKKFTSNLSLLLKWSPYSTEGELLKQFEDIGSHGTKIVIFNLWNNDDGEMELDFESDAKDVMISGGHKMLPSKTVSKIQKQKYVATQLWYSLRAYSSILYLHLPMNFRIILRGHVVDPHYIVNDLKFREGIKYRPQLLGNMEGEINTIIGYLEGSPNIDVHGFNIYHKNRLILPFLPVVSSTNGKGKGVAGVLEANFIKPTHNKQDFERSTLYQRLVGRLREMTTEYWDLHCHLVGYRTKRVPPSLPPSSSVPAYPMQHSVESSAHVNPRPLREIPAAAAASEVSSSELNSHHPVLNGNDIFLTNKRKHDGVMPIRESLKKQAVINGTPTEVASNGKMKVRQPTHMRTQESIIMRQENEKLCAECADLEMNTKELLLKEQYLRLELQIVQEAYEKLSIEYQSRNHSKVEKL